MFVGGHDLVDLRDRNRQRQNAYELSVHADRRNHPGRGGVEFWLIRLEVGDPDEVYVVGAQSFLVCITQMGFAIRTGENIGSEVGSLLDGVDDIALHVQQQRVPIVEAGDDIAKVEVVAGIGR